MHCLRYAASRAAGLALRIPIAKVASRSFAVHSKQAFATFLTRGLLIKARSFSLTARIFNSAEDVNHAAKEDHAFSQLEESASPGENPGEKQHPGETPYGLFVRNLSFDINDQMLKEHFSQFGDVSTAVMVRDARGLSRGYGFVYYDNAEAMNHAASSVHGTFWHGRRVGCLPRLKSVKRDRVSPVTSPTRSLYIGNIPYEATDAELNRLFRELMNITDVRVAVDRTTGWPRGFAHADFSTVEDAERAKEKLTGTMMAGRELRIDFAGTKTGS